MNSSSDAPCGPSHTQASCEHEGLTKYYCSGVAGGAFCSGNFSLYYIDGYTETCPINNNEAVGYTKRKPSNDDPCTNIFSSGLIDLFSDDPNIDCGIYETGQCIDNDTTKYFCKIKQDQPAVLAECDGNSTISHNEISSEACILGASTDYTIYVVAFQNPTCEKVFSPTNVVDITDALNDNKNNSSIDCGNDQKASCTYQGATYYFCYKNNGLYTKQCESSNSFKYASSFPDVIPCSHSTYLGTLNNNTFYIVGFTKKTANYCDVKIYDHLNNDNAFYVKESDIPEGVDKSNLLEEICTTDSDEETKIYRVCYIPNVCENIYKGSYSTCPYTGTFYYDETYEQCTCPDTWMTVEEKRAAESLSEHALITGTGDPCKADIPLADIDSPDAQSYYKYASFEIQKAPEDYPLCQNVIDAGNELGDPTSPRDGYYILSPTEFNDNCVPCHNNGLMSKACLFCGNDVSTENGYNFANSFKITDNTSPCKQGCHKDYACSYTKTDGTTITYCSQCDCTGYATKSQLCQASFEGDPDDIDSSPCMNSGVLDETDTCKLHPTNTPTTTYYKRISCPDGFYTMEEFSEQPGNIIEDNEFLGNNLNISDTNPWSNYLTHLTGENNICNYAAEVVSSGNDDSDGVTVPDPEELDDYENTNRSQDNNLDEYEIKILEPKYKGYNLNCTALTETLPNLEFISQTYFHNYDLYTTCWDITDNQIKYIATCHADYLLPEEGYQIIGNEDICKFNGKDYYKHGGSCPVLFSGKEAVVPASISDDTIRNNYGQVKISFCNDNGTKKKVTYCDPNIYNQICEYPYEYTVTPTKKWCLRNIKGKQVTYSDHTNNITYYINTGQPVQCRYNLDSCDAVIKTPDVDVFIESSSSACVEKYGTAVQTKLCNGEYNIPKYACYYPKNIYKFTTQNCPIGKDLSRPYILINGVKHWDRCDCPPAYKYHVNNCRVYDLYGDTCEQKIDQTFIDQANDPYLKVNTTVKLYSKCKNPLNFQPNGCSTPEGTWAKCYYCCPKGKKATGNLSIDGCGAKIYECK